MNVENAASSYVFEPAAVAGAAGRGIARSCFPVHRIYCVGRNYAAHAVEMGHDPNKEPPFFFQKNPDNLVLDGELPLSAGVERRASRDRDGGGAGKGGADIPVDQALDCVFGYGVGLDMTRRDLQGKAKDMGRPWEVGKAFEASAPCSPLVPASRDRPSRARARSGSTSTASGGRPATSTS